MLLGELAGHCELALLHGLLVSHLRKHTYPDIAPALFCAYRPKKKTGY
jgi:hypothetical protein